MSALPLTWLALAAAGWLVPLPSAAGRRARRLSGRGRLPANRVSAPQWALRRPLAAAAGLGFGAAGAVVAAAFGGMALGVAAAAAAATVGASVCRALARRRDARRRRGVVAAVRLLVAELTAGSRPGAALAAAAAVSAEHASTLAVAAAAATSGADVSGVLLASGAADLEPLAHAWRIGAVAGAPMADVLGRVAADLSDRDGQQRAVAVALAGPRTSAALLAVLPAVGIALGAAMGARPVAFLFGAPGGRALCCTGVLLDLAGVLWTQRLMQRAQRA